jgi:hypothetical protein
MDNLYDELKEMCDKYIEKYHSEFEDDNNIVALDELLNTLDMLMEEYESQYSEEDEEEEEEDEQ